jgi:hypothetical protein
LAIRAAENGASEKEFDALFSWLDRGRTSSIDTKEAKRARLAAQAGRNRNVYVRTFWDGAAEAEKYNKIR